MEEDFNSISAIFYLPLVDVNSECIFMSFISLWEMFLFVYWNWIFYLVVVLLLT